MVDMSAFIFLPLLLVAAGFLMLLPAPLLAAHRQPAAIGILAILLGAGFVHLFWLKSSGADLIVSVIVAVFIAAPLLERARFTGLVLAALAGSAALFTGMTVYLQPALPGLHPLTFLPLAMLAALVVGMAGGMALPLHPSRFRQDGVMRWHGASQAMALAGWVGITLALGITATIIQPDALGLPQIGGALAAAFTALFYAHTHHGDDALQKAGEGLAAGLLITLLAPLSPMAATGLGLLAGFFVTRSEAMASALRIDDAHHFLGALLLPCMLALLMPGIQHSAQLAPALQWLGAALALALLVSLILWPLVMLIFGVALPPRLVREGVRRA